MIGTKFRCIFGPCDGQVLTRDQGESMGYAYFERLSPVQSSVSFDRRNGRSLLVTMAKGALIYTSFVKVVDIKEIQ